MTNWQTERLLEENYTENKRKILKIIKINKNTLIAHENTASITSAFRANCAYERPSQAAYL